jgi:predicted acylesterase/phospholipase RssA
MFGALLGGCVGLPRRAAVPIDATQSAFPSKCSESRFWPNLDLAQLYRDAAASDERERETLIAQGKNPAKLPPAAFLAISGGGDAGAFGAGILVGWTATGTRPQFKVVTGVSAGALIAPFAFLGDQYNDVLQSVAVSIGPRDVFKIRTLIRAMTSDAFADDTALASLIGKYVTKDILAAVAREYARGRVLLIGTTDLDAGQPVVWNMGAIASCGDPAGLPLFRKIMLASASIPGVFPPVMLDVTVNGRQYQEMHVDGGVLSQVFLFPPSFLRVVTNNYSVNARERSVYAIRNGRIESSWTSVPRRTTFVARRALSALIDTQGINDLYRLEVVSNQEHEGFNVAYIGGEFNYPHNGMFDTDYMRHLFEYAYELAKSGKSWHMMLPGDQPNPVSVESSALSSPQAMH